MELDKLWSWQKKKLPCKIRSESGNPAGDSLREMFAELAGADLNELLNEMKAAKKKKEAASKIIDHEGEKTFKEVLFRSRVLGATKLALERMSEQDRLKASSLTQKNAKKVFTVLPSSPPKRVLIEIQRERSKPLRLPDQDEHKSATEKLEKKLSKERKARMAKHEQLAREEEEFKKKGITSVENAGKALMSTVFQPYDGDRFSSEGPYLEGMLYLSRMADASIKTQNKSGSAVNDSENSKESTDKEFLSKEIAKTNEKDIKLSESGDDSIFRSESSVDPDANMKLNCAISLCNWSRNPANASRLASEGAVRAIIQLALEPINRIAMYCVAAFRYMSEYPELAVSIIEEGGMSTISEIINSAMMDDFIANNLAITLVNLTRIVGKEGQLVEGAIALAIMNIITVKPELGAVCARGLYNLTCVDVSYSLIERVIRSLVALSVSGTANVKHLCAAALCNLSDLKSVRPRMVEEGAIDVLTTLSRGAETRTRRVCAVILQNLSASKSVRSAMASHNSVTAAFGLSSDQDPIILRCVGLTLSRLAMEPSNCQKIIAESGITALCNIAVKYPTIPGISQPVSSAFQLLSANQNARIELVDEGAVTAIASLFRSSMDMFTLQHSLLALCNLLCEPENHLQIVQQGLIQTLISMCDQENDLIKDFLSLAFLNLSVAEESRKHIVNGGAIVAIIQIAKQNSDGTKKRCAATLCNISHYTPGMSRMVNDGIIPCIANLVMSKDTMTVHYSCAALCRLCCTVENAKLILESEAVPRLVQGTKEGSIETRQFCGAVLSSLSFYESCRVTLCELGSISALKGLAQLNDDTTKQRCLVAFANLSCEVSIQTKMVNEGVVSIIAELANSYQEINYICCAKAICNLACAPKTKLNVATEGGVHALLMISMVQSVDRLTKLLCVLGLNNLLDETTIQFMLEEGLVGSIANISKIGDPHISNLCAKIFNHLSHYLEAKLKIAERQGALNALFKLTEPINNNIHNEVSLKSKSIADTPTNVNRMIRHNNTLLFNKIPRISSETEKIAIRTCCNLILCENVRGKAILAGIFPSIERGLELDDSKDTVMQCLISIFSICSPVTCSSFMEILARSSSIPQTLLLLATKSTTNNNEYAFIAKVLSMLAWLNKSRLFLQKREIFDLLFNVIENNLKAESADLIAKANAKLILVYLIEALRTISDCESEEVMVALANMGVIDILYNATVVCGEDSMVMYDVSVLMFRFASTNLTTRIATSVDKSADILIALQNHTK
eukprot:gene13506-18121_t